MKKGYWIIPLCLIIIAGIIIVIMQQNKSAKSDSDNLCEEVISLNDIKSLCSPSFQISDDINDSYYFVPNEMNLGEVIQPTDVSSRTLRNGTEWLCEKDVSNGKRTYESDSNYLSVGIETFSSQSFADEAWTFYNSGNKDSNESGSMTFFKEGKDFGDKSFILAFAGGEIYDKVSNQTATTLKSTTIQFLKGKKIITITEASSKENNLVCGLEQIQKLAEIVDKKIK